MQGGGAGVIAGGLLSPGVRVQWGPGLLAGDDISPRCSLEGGGPQEWRPQVLSRAVFSLPRPPPGRESYVECVFST